MLLKSNKSGELLALVAFFLLAVLPVAGGLGYMALYASGVIGALNSGFTGAYWSATLSDGGFWRAIALSAGISTAAVALSVALAMGALLLWRERLERPVVFRLLHLPLVFPPLVAAFAGLLLLSNTGVFSRLARWAGWSSGPSDFPELVNDEWHAGVCLLLIYTTFGFILVLLVRLYRSLKVDALETLARTLGAGAVQMALRVTIPVLLRRAFPVIALYWIILFGAFEVPLLLGRQSPAMISAYIHRKFGKFNLLDTANAYVAALTYAAILLVLLFLIHFRYAKTRNPS